MPSRFHEWLIDQVTNVIAGYPECMPFRRKYPHVGGAIEPVFPHELMRLDMSRRADAYIFGGDQADSPVFVEAGEMKPYDKWSHVIFSDGKPPRILSSEPRLGFLKARYCSCVVPLRRRVTYERVVRRPLIRSDQALLLKAGLNGSNGSTVLRRDQRNGFAPTELVSEPLFFLVGPCLTDLLWELRSTSQTGGHLIEGEYTHGQGSVHVDLVDDAVLW
jgi:hypothetical protein